MIEPDHPDLSIGQQCKLLSIARSSHYYEPKGETEQNLGLMRRIDEQFLETPFSGVRQMTWHLRNDGHQVNEKRIRRLMRLMGLTPIYQKPNTSRPAKGHKTYPYLLRGLRVDRPNQVLLSAMQASPAGQGVLGHHLSAYAPRVPLSGGDHGLAYPQGSVLADLEHAGGRLLRRSAERGHPQVRPARDNEYRSRIPVHVLRLDGSAPPVWGADLDGWERLIPRQHLHREAVAHPEIRVRLPACLGDRFRDKGGNPEMDDILQPPAPLLSPRRQATGAGLLAEKRYQPTRSAGATSSLNDARSCPRIGE